MKEPRLMEQMMTIVTRSEIVDARLLRHSYCDTLKKFAAAEEINAVEVGVFEGINAMYMLMYCEKLKLTLVDSWENLTIYTGGPKQGEGYQRLIRTVAGMNISPFQDRVKFTLKNSEDSVKDFSDETFDYIYIDGDHTTEAVRLDMKLWWPKLKKGGIFAGHDILMPEVAKAVDEFIKEYGMKGYNKDLKAPASDWWFEKC